MAFPNWLKDNYLYCSCNNDGVWDNRAIIKNLNNFRDRNEEIKKTYCSIINSVINLCIE